MQQDSKTVPMKPKMSFPLVMAWIGMLYTIAPPIVWHYVAEGPFPSPLWVQGVPLFGLALFAFFDRRLKEIRWYFSILVVLFFGASLFRPLISQMSWWQSMFAAEAGRFDLMRIFGSQLLKLAEAVVVLVMLLCAGYSRNNLFLRIGDLGAKAEPEKLLDIKEGETWKGILRVVAPIIWGITFAVLYFMIRPDWGNFSNLFVDAPLILFNSANNAFCEEFLTRAAIFCILCPVLGKKPSLWLTAVFFGLGHYAGGFPSGWIGVIMGILLSYILGKCILETKGLFYAWFVHFGLDVIVFAFLSLR